MIFNMNVQSNPGGFPRFFALILFNRCIFLTALRRMRSIYICMSDDPVHMNIVDDTGYSTKQTIEVDH